MNTEELGQQLSSDLAFFNQLILPNFFTSPIPAFHKPVYDGLSDPEVRLLLVMMARGRGKTTTLQGFLCQQIVNALHKVILYMSDTYSQAEIHTQSVRDELLYNDYINKLYGSQQGSGRWTNELWTTANGVTVMPVGSTKSIRGIKFGGNRPSLIIIDDPENDENSETPEQRDKLWQRLFSVIKPMMQAGGNNKIVYLGTPINEDCVLYRLYDLLSKPKYRNSPHYRLIELSAFDEDDNSIWPERFPTDKLKEEEGLYAEAGMLDSFYREFRLKVISGKDSEFPRDKVCHYSVAPSDVKWYASMDMAFSTNRQSDYCALVVFGVSRSAAKVYVEKAIRGRFKPDKFLDLIEETNKRYGLVRLFLQNITLDEFFRFYARSHGYNHIPFKKVSISRQRDAKTRRISSLSPAYFTGNLVFKYGLNDLLSELWMFPRSKYDDLSDALATGVKELQLPSATKLVAGKNPLDDPFSYESIMAELSRKRKSTNYGLTYMPGNYGAIN